ncbi:MAG: cytochrome P450 [Isosphaeraceae bacterium]
MPSLVSPPGPKGRFLLGSTLDYMRDPLEFLTRCAREHGDVVRLRLGNSTYYALNHPALVEEALRAHASSVIKDRLTRMISPIVGQGLLTSEGAFWRRQRKLAQPAFQRDAIDRYGTVMVEHASRLVNTWRDGQVRDAHDDMMSLTLDIVAKTLFDTEVGPESRDVGETLAVMMDYYLDPWKFFPLREWLPTRKNRLFRAAVRRLDEIIYGIISRRRASDHEPGDLLSHLLAAQDDEGTGMTDRQLRDECVTLFLAGHETTALTLTYTFHLLARHPEAEARLTAELDEVLAGRPPRATDVPRLRFTDWVIRESMRLYPPAWGIGREAATDLEIGGYHVPKGTQLLISQWVLHRDPRWFDDPESFRPERWDGDLARRLPKGAYIPFGDGPRVCIGNHFAMMEAVLILATLAQRHRLALVADETLELSPSITLRPKSGTRMIVHARREAAPQVV